MTSSPTPSSNPGRWSSSRSKDGRGAPPSRRWWNWAVTLLLACGPSAPGQPIEPADPPVDAAPLRELITFVGATPEDQGVRSPGTSVRRLVYVKNGSVGAVQVRIIGKTCACVEASVAREIVEAGKAGEVAFTAPVVEADGQQRHGVHVVVEPLDGAGGEPVRGWLWVSWTPDVDIMAFPSKLAVSAVRGEPASSELVVRRTGRRALTLRGFSAPGIPGCRVGAIAEERGLLRLRITVDSQSPLTAMGTVTLDVGGDSVKQVKIPLCVTILPDLFTEPSGVTVTAGSVVEPIRLRLKCRGQKWPAGITVEAADVLAWLRVEIVHPEPERGIEPFLRVSADRATETPLGGEITLRDAGGNVVGLIPIAVLPRGEKSPRAAEGAGGTSSNIPPWSLPPAVSRSCRRSRRRAISPARSSRSRGGSSGARRTRCCWGRRGRARRSRWPT